MNYTLKPQEAQLAKNIAFAGRSPYKGITDSFGILMSVQTHSIGNVCAGTVGKLEGTAIFYSASPMIPGFIMGIDDISAGYATIDGFGEDLLKY